MTWCDCFILQCVILYVLFLKKKFRSISNMLWLSFYNVSFLHVHFLLGLFQICCDCFILHRVIPTCPFFFQVCFKCVGTVSFYKVSYLHAHFSFRPVSNVLWLFCSTRCYFHMPVICAHNDQFSVLRMTVPGTNFSLYARHRRSGRVFFSRVIFLCHHLYSFRSTPMLPQLDIKDPGHSSKNAGGGLHLNIQSPLTQWSQD